ncbi:MAG TPA: hypothetical protein VFD40_01620 [Candidatus Paceibacterota bacterium]|nr:hypothetical protein [Candidatus Paceibacterota bacterium]
MKEKKIEWKEIGRLKNGKFVIYHIKTKIINVESDYMYSRIPNSDEREEILKIINKNFKKVKRWQKVLELIRKKL